MRNKVKTIIMKFFHQHASKGQIAILTYVKKDQQMHSEMVLQTHLMPDVLTNDNRLFVFPA